MTVLSAGDVDYMDPGQAFYTFSYQVMYSMQRPLYYFSPEEPDKQIPDLADGDPEISADGKTVTVKIKPGVKFSPAGQPRGHGRRREVRDGARLQRERAAGLRVRLLRRHRRARRASRRPASRTSRASRPLDDTTLEFSLKSRVGRPARCGARDAADDPGARGVREGVRRQEPVDVQPERRLHRPVHGQERRRRASSPAGSRASRSTSFATRTGTRRPTSGPHTWTPGKSRRATTTRQSSSRRILQGQSLVQGDAAPPAQVAQDGDPAVQGPADRTRRRAARATSRSTRRRSRSTTSTSARR